jgi:NADH dehydrogenase [ubiquinone] 1 alpha subcomplex assembly factor 7
MSLKARLAGQIAANGPMNLAQFMQVCLLDPNGGYYATRPDLGEQGDFITAPLVSQMFGELIGLWAVETWRTMGQPRPVRLVEAGPGDGTLMSDILRAAQLVPEFLSACELWLVEISEPLIEQQMKALAGAPLTPTWVPSLRDVPGGAPVLLIANELLDCMAARQFVKGPAGWVERLVTLDDQGGLVFVLSGEAEAGAPVMEVSAAQESFGALVGEIIAREGGAALLIDYGRAEAGFGDTFQALSRHQKVDPLADPGGADLTVHADFPAVMAAAEAQGCACALTTQGQFLMRLGVHHRAAALARARPDRAEILNRQLERLISPDQMGELFKVCVVHRRNLPCPPGFQDPQP